MIIGSRARVCSYHSVHELGPIRLSLFRDQSPTTPSFERILKELVLQKCRQVYRNSRGKAGELIEIYVHRSPQISLKCIHPLRLNNEWHRSSLGLCCNGWWDRNLTGVVFSLHFQDAFNLQSSPSHVEVVICIFNFRRAQSAHVSTSASQLWGMWT